jgi:hypothetical protein
VALQFYLSAISFAHAATNNAIQLNRDDNFKQSIRKKEKKKERKKD